MATYVTVEKSIFKYRIKRREYNRSRRKINKSTRPVDVLLTMTATEHTSLPAVDKNNKVTI